MSDKEKLLAAGWAVAVAKDPRHPGSELWGHPALVEIYTRKAALALMDKFPVLAGVKQ